MERSERVVFEIKLTYIYKYICVDLMVNNNNIYTYIYILFGLKCLICVCNIYIYK